ncbi:YgfZ/GcvT domain-containing protein [Pusillimonas minor]|uniref:Folate-binding protein YgfZ n=1 Tax=Pusillimonas minor TaxID=2697024 RepID=A0A842HMD9_9BURK|nr:folate-binding protein YgfZ [Pusillimonas minor]MBC2769477.1 folate-binding protein YgfZ [Pusillimonas minor]
MTETSRTTTVLADFAVIEAVGDDTAGFLQGQLSNDIAGLAPGQACLAAYCTPKGRMLASMVVWQVAGTEAPTYRALIRHDIAPAIVKRLSMFVLRAKVKLSLLPAVVQGVSCTTPGAVPTAAAPAAASWPKQAAPYTVVDTPSGAFIAAPCANHGQARWWHIDTSTSAPNGTDLAAASAWHAADIAAGLPWVELATQDMFIPQTLNFDLIGGVSFTKGCYPGQEVVARSHYRGTVKRRMARGQVALDPAYATPGIVPGTDTFHAGAPDSPVGRIVNAVVVNGLAHVLLEVQLADLGQADLRVGAADGPAIVLQDLPYAIVANG